MFFQRSWNADLTEFLGPVRLMKLTEKGWQFLMEDACDFLSFLLKCSKHSSEKTFAPIWNSIKLLQKLVSWSMLSSNVWCITSTKVLFNDYHEHDVFANCFSRVTRDTPPVLLNTVSTIDLCLKHPYFDDLPTGWED